MLLVKTIGTARSFTSGEYLLRLPNDPILSRVGVSGKTETVQNFALNLRLTLETVNGYHLVDRVTQFLLTFGSDYESATFARDGNE